MSTISSNVLSPLQANPGNVTLSNYITPDAANAPGVANIVLTMGSLSSTVPVTVGGTTSIASIQLNDPSFESDDVDAADVSFELCSATFRGFVGDQSQLSATFTYTDEDLACPFTLPLAALDPSSAPRHDPGVLIQALTSADTAAITTSSRYLVLQDSSVASVTITADVAAQCTASGFADMSGDLPIYANLKARDYQVDFGHQCGAPVALMVSRRVQRPLALGDTVQLPMRLAKPDGAVMRSITIATEYDDTLLTVTDWNTEGAGATFTPALNYGDSNVVRFNGVWSSTSQPGRLQLLFNLLINVRYICSACLRCAELWYPAASQARLMSCACQHSVWEPGAQVWYTCMVHLAMM